MSDLWIQETFENATEGHIFGDGPWVETSYDHTGDLFRALMREYGRCISKMYVGNARQVGWVFEGIDHYDDGRGDPYLRHVWVQVSLRDPEEGLSSPWWSEELVQA